MKNEKDLDNLIKALKRLIEETGDDFRLPAELSSVQGFDQLYFSLADIKKAIAAMEKGDFSYPLAASGYLPEAAENRQETDKKTTLQTSPSSETLPPQTIFSERPEDFAGIDRRFSQLAELLEMKEAERKEALAHFQTIFKTVPDGIFIARLSDSAIINVNEAFAAITGYTQEDVVSKSSLELNMYEDFLQRQAILNELTQSGICQNKEVLLRKKTGEKIVALIWAKTISLSEVLHYICVIRDITEHKSSEIRIEESERRLKAAQTMAHVGSWELDLLSNIIWASEETFRIYGIDYTSAYVPVDMVLNCIHPDHREALDIALNNVLTKNEKCEIDFKIINLKTKEEHFVRSNAALITDDNGKPTKITGTVLDVTEYKKAEEAIRYLSYNDQLTGLFNRRFYEEAARRLDNEKYVPLTIVLMDVNGLKLTNDAFGHKTGDALLEKVGAVLKKECRSEDIVARIGGDEFILLLPETDAKNADKIINRINKAIAKEKIENIILSVSVGFAVKQDDSENLDEVFKKAEDEMYKRKLIESPDMRRKTIDLIMNTLYEKSDSAAFHSKKVGALCEAIAAKMNFTREDISKIRIAGLMHDIGKIGIDLDIINKPQTLDSEENEEMKRHSEIGYRILSSVNEFREIADYILQHHEKWNGKGYPRGLKGEEISLQARIIAVADAFDAMTSDRSYRNAVGIDDAINEIKKGAGTQFDPYVAKVFVCDVMGRQW